MDDLKDPFLRGSLNNSEYVLEYTVPHNQCVIFSFDKVKHEFVIEREKALDIIEDKIPLDLFYHHADKINSPSNLQPPSAIFRVVVTSLVFLVLAVALIIFLFIWFLSILDLVVLGLILWAMRKIFIILWVWRSHKFGQHKFIGLRKYIKNLNKYYKDYNLKWSMDETGNWLQLGAKNINNEIFK